MSGTRFALVIGILAAGSLRTAARGQGPADATERPAVTLLGVSGEVPRPLKLTADGFARLPRHAVVVKEPNGAEVKYEGVLMVEVLKEAGVKFGEDLRGPALTNYLMVEASDGYRVVFSLAELDPAFADRVVLVADRRGDQPLTPNEGSLRLVVPGEKRHARWVRKVVSLSVGRG